MSDYQLHPAALPTWSQRAALRMLTLLGWKMRFRPLPGPHGIAVVYPHTSNWDFLIGLLGKWALDLPFRWLAKDSLFRGPTGPLMRYWGGIAVDRRAPMGATRKLAEQMLAEKWCWVGITPEGTRGYRPHWKSGFYHLASAANVPLMLVYLDYRKKELCLIDHLRLTGDQDADMAAIAAVYKDVTALYPGNAAPIQLAPPHTGPERRKSSS
ncbi:glycerol acyltransferase [Massilia sp. Dwa41.01b]|uniref:1-acyl-sn-glycerol-3-phosphate acyltransferase n=1 Tax=unclassified Massilia TaxID=2609279 RepID=UPI001600F62C|nr:MULTISPECIES: 1-acyl-sn-glycerol-3-phosphate acyltransferase [unclassified Massilia]QNA88816.1 glycerol acyltransferase [Massilia sp. Dwa41.01b]QNA99713.1 glycerol acyltransferase [Massilia sp. Se16.2.3]